MNISPGSMRHLAQKLLALEAANPSSESAGEHEAARVCDKLRILLTRLAGADGFSTLLRRAMVLARKDDPSLESVAIRPDGSLEGFEKLSENDGNEAALTFIAHLLGLLSTFIGEPLTRRVVREAWDDQLPDE